MLSTRILLGHITNVGPVWGTRVSSFGTADIYGVCYGNGTYVACGAGGRIATSTDSVNWIQRTSNVTVSLRGICYGNGLYVAVGDNGTIVTSTNGTSWSAQTSNFGTSNINGVAYGNNTFVVVGANARIGTSSNGTMWTMRTINSDKNGANAIYNTVSFGVNSINTGFAVGGGNNGFYGSVNGFSTDGITWTIDTVTKNIYSNIRAACCGAGCLLLGGDGGNFLNCNFVNQTSQNGSQAFVGTIVATGICFNGNTQFLIAGLNGSIIIADSTNLGSYVNETTISNLGTTSLYGCCYGNGRYIIVGANGTLAVRS